jgi:uncharacterized protein (DUF1778 family)
MVRPRYPALAGMRLTVAESGMLKLAATLEGKTVSAFLRDTVLPVARASVGRALTPSTDQSRA